MIIGIGTDILQKVRVKEIFDKYGNKFIDKVLTQKEKSEFKTRKNRKRNFSQYSKILNLFQVEESCMVQVVMILLLH